MLIVLCLIGDLHQLDGSAARGFVLTQHQRHPLTHKKYFAAATGKQFFIMGRKPASATGIIPLPSRNTDVRPSRQIKVA